MNTDEIKTCSPNEFVRLFHESKRDPLAKRLFVKTTSKDHVPVFEEVTAAAIPLFYVNIIVLTTGTNAWPFKIHMHDTIEYVIR